MDILEASVKLERIELLAKIAHASEMSSKEKTIALTWIGEIAEEMRCVVRGEIKNPRSGGVSGSGCSLQ
ncbi:MULTISPECIES: hypothetical protein [Enterobacter cloacae complex]|jgi:hypothetical protein|uniref:hypothetical protein n=1 Tax=Enterobacter cloacae complex TaxID=354276 RepID=UPI000999C9FF|nr:MULTISPECIES: hypothetical protein [Enterobacter cloacae complex]HDW0119053.1 hypothetical protein [Enterobacter asburiae]AWC84827.1 hypothetical protein AM410_10440 [Enterobacter cloacae complex sp. FDA-CDC-AR_0164]ELJ5765641.1 hypothetical protein [Enterobacter hormaechei]OPB25707.1 hypothetical protein BFW94_05140 [Enterobacter ludwigii]WBT25024.1 hypothetical protein PF325_07220 [Enterobacter hormaechei]